MHVQGAGLEQKQGGASEYPSVQQSGAPPLLVESQPMGGVGRSAVGQLHECDDECEQLQPVELVGGRQALQKSVVIVEQMPVNDAQQAEPTCAVQDANPSDAAQQAEAEAIITMIEEEHEHQYDENAHHKIQLKEETSMASVFMSDDDVERPHYDVTDHYFQTGVCQAVANHSHFQNLTVGVVILNALYIGIDADWNRSENLFDAHWFFMITSNAFCVYFTAELLVRFFCVREETEGFQ